MILRARFGITFADDPTPPNFEDLEISELNSYLGVVEDQERRMDYRIGVLCMIVRNTFLSSDDIPTRPTDFFPYCLGTPEEPEEPKEQTQEQMFAIMEAVRVRSGGPDLTTDGVSTNGTRNEHRSTTD